MRENGILPIDLVVMNLYAFETTVASGAGYDTCIENIDIGGPSMLRSSAKNHAYVTVLSSPSQYSAFIDELTFNKGAISFSTRRALAAQSFAISASYDTAISQYFATQLSNESDSIVTPKIRDIVSRSYECLQPLKYGCNPHQKPAAIYRTIIPGTLSQVPCRVLNGVPGYINLLDACNAWQLVAELRRALDLPAAASFKHCSPAGAAVAVPLSVSEAAAYEVKILYSIISFKHIYLYY
jgi:phosphoribosylaminoimidazolecarboxamide formyltransferase/IMP cyclohydrolase